MASQSQETGGTEKASAAQNVRVVPIFVEGRDEPLLNKDFPDAGVPQGGHHHHHQQPQQHQFHEVPPQPRMDFGAEMPGFRHGSIFDRAKDFPVRGGSAMRDNMRDFFRDSPSPTQRGESPMRNIPVNHNMRQFGRQASPQPQATQPRPATQERQRTVSGGHQPQQQEQWVRGLFKRIFLNLKTQKKVKTANLRIQIDEKILKLLL